MFVEAKGPFLNPSPTNALTDQGNRSRTRNSLYQGYRLMKFFRLNTFVVQVEMYFTNILETSNCYISSPPRSVRAKDDSAVLKIC